MTDGAAAHVLVMTVQPAQPQSDDVAGQIRRQEEGRRQRQQRRPQRQDHG